MESILALTGMGVTPYSSRGLKQSLQPISGSVQTRRTVNGTLHDVSDPIFRKYESTITGEDQEPPAVEGIWPGMQLVVDCIVEIAVLGVFEDVTDGTSEEDVVFDKPHVPGSVRNDGTFTYYRPRLTMLITGFEVERDEWDATVGWAMQLEEV
jgi:hypothetical protein